MASQFVGPIYLIIIFTIILNKLHTHMKSFKKSLITLLLIFGSSAIFAQALKTQTINEGSIDDQFEFVLIKSSNWNDERGQAYEVIKSNLILSLKAHVQDSLKAIKNRLDSTNTIVQTQQDEIESLKADLSKTQDTLNATNIEKNSMSLFGFPMNKTSYNLLMWITILALFALLLLFIIKFKNSNSVTKIAKDNLADVEEEFEEHRRIALEREQKVRRQLQDEINKQKS